MGDVGAAIQRAEDKTAQMQARASAIDELIASGALDDATSLNRGDDITRELEAMSSQAEVEAGWPGSRAAPTSCPAVDTPEAIEAAPTPGEILAEEPVAEPVTESVTEGAGETTSEGQADKA